MAAYFPITARACDAPGFASGVDALDDCSAWLEQIHGILNVVLDAHCDRGDSPELTDDQLGALYAAGTLLGWARASLRTGHDEALRAR